MIVKYIILGHPERYVESVVLDGDELRRTTLAIAEATGRRVECYGLCGAEFEYVGTADPEKGVIPYLDDKRAQSRAVKIGADQEILESVLTRWPHAGH